MLYYIHSNLSYQLYVSSLTSVSSVDPEASIMACLVGNKTVWVKGFKIAFGAWLTLSAKNKTETNWLIFFKSLNTHKNKSKLLKFRGVQYNIRYI